MNNDSVKQKQLRNRGRRGQALVESVLALVAMLAILGGLLEIGQILYVHQTLVERARYAVRWAAVNTWDDTNSPTQVTNLVLYGTTTPNNSAQPIFGLSAQNVSVTRPQPDYSCADRIVVTVSGYALMFLSNAIVQANSNSQNVSGQISGLTIQQSLPYEVSNGSSH